MGGGGPVDAVYSGCWQRMRFDAISMEVVTMERR